MIKYGIAKRQYVKYTLVVLLNVFALLLVGLVFFFDDESEFTLTESQLDIIAITMVILAFVVLILGLIISWILLKKKKFYADQEEFVVEQGFVFKRTTKLSFDKIVTISIKRNLLDLILGLSKLEVDSGSAMSVKAEVSLTLDKYYANELKLYLEVMKNGNSLELPNPSDVNKADEKKQAYFHQSGWKELLLSGMTDSVIQIVFLVFLSMSSLVLFLVRQDTEEVTPQDIEVLLVCFIGFLFTVVIVAIINLISYYKHRVIIEDKHIEYSYGLINRKTFKVAIDKIDGIYLKQPLLYRLFNRYIVEASVIGIGELDNQNNRESKKILLFATREKVESLLALLNIQTIEEKELKKPNKLRFFNFIVLPLCIITLLVIPMPIVLANHFLEYASIFIIGLLMYLIIVMQLYLNMRQKGYGINQRFLVVSKGGFTKVVSITKISRIQSIIFKQGPILMLENLGSIQMVYRGFGKTRTINYYDRSVYEDLKHIILQ